MERYTHKITETLFAHYHLSDPEQERTFVLKAFQKDNDNVGFKLIVVDNKTKDIKASTQSHIEKGKFNLDEMFPHFEDLLWRLHRKPEYALTAVRSVARMGYLPPELLPFKLPRAKQGLAECKQYYAGEMTIYNDALNCPYAKYYAFA